LVASAAATNSVGAMAGSDSAFDAAVAKYAAWLTRQPLADRSKGEYERWVRSFVAWAKDAPQAGE